MRRVKVLDTMHSQDLGREHPISSSPRSMQADLSSTMAAGVGGLAIDRTAGEAAQGSMAASLAASEEAAPAARAHEDAAAGSATARARARAAMRGTSAFLAVPRPPPLASGAPPIGHYHPKDELVHERIRQADMGVRRERASTLAYADTDETVERRAQLVASKLEAAAAAERERKRQHEASLPSVPFRSTTRQRSAVAVPVASAAQYAVDESAVRPHTACLVDMAKSTARSAVVAGQRRDAPLDMFYDPSEAPTRPRTSGAGAVRFALQVPRAAPHAQINDLFYDVREPPVGSGPAPDFAKQVPRELHTNRLVALTAQPGAAAGADVAYDAASARDKLARRHAPAWDFGKTTGRASQAIASSVEATYNPNHDAVAPRMRQAIAFDHMARNPPLVVEMHDLTYSVSHRAIEPHVPAVRLGDRANEAQRAARRARRAARRSPRRRPATAGGAPSENVQPATQYNPQWHLVVPQAPRALDFSKVRGRAGPAAEPAAGAGAELHASGSAGARPADQSIRPIPERPKAHAQAPNMARAVGRETGQSRVLGPFYDCKYDLVLPRMPVPTFSKVASR